MREVLCGKIHQATVTDANVAYTGSIAIDPELLRLSDIWPGQKVLVVSSTSGARLWTYTIIGKPGEISMNGAAALLIQKNEIVIVMGFTYSPIPLLEPKNILVDSSNQFVRYL